MSEDIAIRPQTEISKYATEEALSGVMTVGEYIPYIQLIGSSATLAKQGKFPMGNFGLFKGKVPIDLGPSFDAIVLSWRPKAMEFGDGVLSFYDSNNPEFKRITDAAENGQQGYSFGPEYLLYLPDFDEIATFLFGNKSARMEAPNLHVIFTEQQEAGTYTLVNFKADLVENKKKQTWHVPVVEKSESEISRFVSDTDMLDRILEKFNNPKETEVITAEEERPM